MAVQRGVSAPGARAVAGYCPEVTAPTKRWVEVDGAATTRRRPGSPGRSASIPLAARALAARGLADPVLASRFLSPRLEDLPDPFTMKGMEGAVARIVRAVEEGQRIACYGDYDVDGVTSTVLLSGFLRRRRGRGHAPTSPTGWWRATA